MGLEIYLLNSTTIYYFVISVLLVNTNKNGRVGGSSIFGAGTLQKVDRHSIGHGVNELEKKKYWVYIKYRNGKNEHIYYIPDIPFEEHEVRDIIEDGDLSF